MLLTCIIIKYAVLLHLQINRLVSAGANVLAAVAVGPRREIGTVIDYAYYVYSLVCIVFSLLFLKVTYDDSCFVKKIL